MDNKVPELKLKDGELEIEGNFTFEFSEVTVNENFVPIKKVTFDWCAELSQAEVELYGREKVF